MVIEHHSRRLIHFDVTSHPTAQWTRQQLREAVGYEANSICERVIGTIRRECLDWIIPLSEAHLRQTLKAWVTHYNRGRPHTALGPGVPGPPASLAVPLSSSRHRLDDFRSVHAKAILSGLHHEYSLARA